MEPCACTKQSEVVLQCEHVLCESCAYSSVVASGGCPRCHQPIARVQQRGGNLTCQLRNIRVTLLLQEGETIHSVVADRFKISRSVLKIVSKGHIRGEEEALNEWRADPGQVFFVVGSAGGQQSSQTTEVKGTKMRESAEKFKEWQRAESERLAASHRMFEAKQSQTCVRRAELTMRRASQVVTQNGVAQFAMAVFQGVGLFLTSLVRPFDGDEEQISMARAIASENQGQPRRGMGGIRRPETHTTGGMGGG